MVTILAALALEVLPITAWLMLGAALVTGSLRGEALPFWFLYMTALVSALLAATARQSRTTRRAARFGRFLVLLIGVVIALSISPSARPGGAPYTPFSWLWLPVLFSDGFLLEHILIDLGLAGLTAYLWWRGRVLGRDGIEYERLLFSFQFSVALVVMAIIVGILVKPATQSVLEARFALILPVTVGMGLVGLTLANVAETTRHRSTGQETDARHLTQAAEGSWLLTALGLAAAVIGAALVGAQLFAYDLSAAVTESLHPVGEALTTVARWLLAVVIWLLNVFDLFLGWLLSLFGAPSHASQSGGHHKPTPQLPPLQPTTVPLAWVTAARIMLIVVIVVLLAIILARVVRAGRRTPRLQAFTEERESLDAGAYLRDRISRPRGLHRRRRAAPEDALSGRSIRQLYREVLRAAQRAGLGRQPQETPAEYRMRVAAATLTAGPSTNSTPFPRPDLETLTQQYELARYGRDAGGTIDSQDYAVAATSARRLVGWFARRPMRGAGRSHHEGESKRRA